MTTLTREEAIDAVSEAMSDVHDIGISFAARATTAIARLEELGVVFPVEPATAYTAEGLRSKLIRIAAVIGGGAEVTYAVSSSKWCPETGIVAVYPRGRTAKPMREMAFSGPLHTALASAEHYARSFCEYPPAMTADDLGCAI